GCRAAAGACRRAPPAGSCGADRPCAVTSGLASAAQAGKGGGMSDTISLDEFLAVDIRVGTMVGVEPFPEARKPAFKLRIDFGPEIGVKKSSAQITVHYTAEALVGTKVAAVVNFPPRQIGP